LAVANPDTYAAALAHAGEAAALLDPAGPGGFDWLVQAVGCPLPAALDAIPESEETDRDLALPHED
ncbi:MAG: hypothetical protein M3P95_04270, partial [Actinomycetota bacterium]|nr:hypothetical protein [Actinomycetota bacterium]